MRDHLGERHCQPNGKKAGFAPGVSRMECSHPRIFEEIHSRQERLGLFI